MGEPDDERAWRRLALRVEARRKEMGVSRNQLGTKSEVAIQTWNKVLAGEIVKIEPSLRRMERYLGWEPGDFDKVLEDPKFIPTPKAPPSQDDQILALLQEVSARQVALAARVDEIAEQVGLESSSGEARSR